MISRPRSARVELVDTEQARTLDEQQRIIEDLSGVFSGDIRCDDLAVSMYASDASLFQIKPLGVACPRNRDDVVTLARYASEAHLPLIARGAGSNVTGSSLGAGLIVDFSRYMHAIESVDESSVTVQPGVVLDRLNARLRSVGRYFPPDPSTAAVTTIGGMIGVDSTGSRAIRVGSTRDHLVSLEIVLAGGHVMDCGLEPLAFSRSGQQPGVYLAGDNPDDLAVKRTLVSKLGQLLSNHAELIERHQPAMIRNTSGYFLRGVRQQDSINLPRLLCGSEGTLGLFTSATLHTAPLPDFRGVVLLLFGRMEDAIDAVQAVIPQQPSACDLLDRRLLMLGRENDSRFEHFIPATAEAGLLIEQTGFSERQARKRLADIIRIVETGCAGVSVAVEAYDQDGVEFLWELPRRVLSLLARIKGDVRPLPFTEDVAVPPVAFREFFDGVQRTLQKFEVTSSFYSHAASGQIHMRPLLALPGPSDAARLEGLASEINTLVLSLGGSISGEHGDGLSRSGFVEQQYGPLYSVFREVKTIFDPQNLMNPGKIVTEQHGLIGTQFRPKTEPQLVQLQLHWSADEVGVAADACNGCAGCRTQEDDRRMCPFFREEPSEEATPRAKANVMRSLLNGQLGPTVTSSAEFERLASLCFNCRQCELECPTNTRIPHMMIEARAQAVQTRGIDRATWLLSRAHALGSVASRFAWLINPLMKNRAARWCLEKTFGIDRRRRLPRFSSQSFIDRLADEQTTMELETRRQGIVYFVDYFANHHDPELAEAFMAVVGHQGILVHVPREQSGSGMALVSSGDLEAARAVAADNVRELAEAAREGLAIVCTEPSAALCIRDDYPLLIDHPDTRLVAERTFEAGQFLWQLHASGKLRTDFTPLPLHAVYHTPCHTRALRRGTPLLHLLKLIPGLEIEAIEKGCSGMAGTFGLTRDNFDTSVSIGRPLMDTMRTADVMLGLTECSSCRLQMEQDAAIPTVHPIKLLAAAYGLMPQLRDRLLKLPRQGQTSDVR